jgi:predicted DsbA family dithiol-disulfide isomerase
MLTRAHAGDVPGAAAAARRAGFDVRDDQATARALGITGVPFFVLDRKFGVSGAQPAEVLLSALQQAYAAAHPLSMVNDGDNGNACDDGSCAV